METVKEFIGDLKDRLSNPLISSFIIAWLISNWTIPLTLLFYSPADLKADGYNSYIDVIQSDSNWYRTFNLPLLVAVFYTFAFPFIKAGIKLFHAKISVWNESDILKASEKGLIPARKYINLVKNFEEEREAFQKFAMNEASMREELLQTKTQLEKWRLFNSNEILNGTWVSGVRDNRGNETTTEFSFLNGDLLGSMEAEGMSAKIIKVHGSPETLNISFDIEMLNSNNRGIVCYDLEFENEDLKRLNGTRNGTSVYLVRKD